MLPLDDDQPSEWEVLARLALVLQGAGTTADPALVDDLMITSLVQAAVGDETSPIHGRDVDEILGLLAPRTGPERILDLQLRTGPYGEGFGADPDGLSLDVLLANPHGVDLGALKPRLPDVLRTPDGMIALAPELLLADIPRLWDGLDGRRDHPFVLVGRRDLRSNNSWMHNVSVLVKGKPRCTAHLHPDDAASLGLADGDDAIVRSRVGEVRVPVEVTDAIRHGVVSIPHGWGHDLDGVQLDVARAHAGVNSNLLADETLFDPISGNAVLNGIPVEVLPAPSSASSPRPGDVAEALRRAGLRGARVRGVAQASQQRGERVDLLGGERPPRTPPRGGRRAPGGPSGPGARPRGTAPRRCSGDRWGTPRAPPARRRPGGRPRG